MAKKQQRSRTGKSHKLEKETRHKTIETARRLGFEWPEETLPPSSGYYADVARVVRQVGGRPCLPFCITVSRLALKCQEVLRKHGLPDTLRPVIWPKPRERDHDDRPVNEIPCWKASWKELPDELWGTAGIFVDEFPPKAEGIDAFEAWDAWLLSTEPPAGLRFEPPELAVWRRQQNFPDDAEICDVAEATADNRYLHSDSAPGYAALQLAHLQTMLENFRSAYRQLTRRPREIPWETLFATIPQHCAELGAALAEGQARGLWERDALLGRKHSDSQRSKANARWNTPIRAKVYEIISRLAEWKDAWGDPLPPNDLWGHLFSELEEARLPVTENNPQANITQQEYEIEGLGPLTYDFFRKRINRARQQI